MNKQRVYRAGSMVPAPDAGAAKEITEHADAVCPHPAPRTGSLFAAPTLPGVVRWVLGNDMCRYETRVREITVDADTTWVYKVDAWEGVSWSGEDPSSYWGTGMTLTQWLAVADEQDLDPTEWEVLVRPENVLSYRNVSGKRLLAAAPQRRLLELENIVRRWRRAA